MAEAVDVANRIAPEHLELAVARPERWLPRVRHAGAIFLGEDAPEPFGDYLAGPNHVLPTGGSARFSSPLGVYDFIKRSSVIAAGPRDARTASVRPWCASRGSKASTPMLARSRSVWMRLDEAPQGGHCRER